MGQHFSAKWLEHFRRSAFAARDSVKEVTKVGAALVGPNNEVLLTAFNGPSIGVKDSPDRRSRTNGLKYKYSSHAERNLISFASRRGISTEGLTVYATHYPCSGCANALVQAGISCVIVGHGQYVSADGDVEHSKQIFRECNVQVIEHAGSDDLERADALARAALLHIKDDIGESLYYQAVRSARYIPDVLPIDYKIVTLLSIAVNTGIPIHIQTVETLFGGEVADAIAILSRKRNQGYLEDYPEYIERIAYSKNAKAIVAAMAVNLDLTDPDRAWEREDEMRPLFRDVYIPARKVLYDGLHDPKVVQEIKLWGIDIRFNGSYKVFRHMSDIPYNLMRED